MFTSNNNNNSHFQRPINCSTKQAIFYPEADSYIYPLDAATSDPLGNNAYFPLEVDTEYTHGEYDRNNPSPFFQITLTAQARSINIQEGVIYAHRDLEPLARHTVFSSGFVAVDYLRDLGHSVILTRGTWAEIETKEKEPPLPWIQFDLYAFFAVAELFRIFTDGYREDILFLITNSHEKRGIVQERRLRTFTKEGKKYRNWVEMPWILTLNEIKYRVRLSIFDTCAVQGNTNYQIFCQNSGVTLTAKDNFTSEQKSRMLDMYLDHPHEFDEYALGDLHNHDALMGNLSQLEQIYDSLDLSNYCIAKKLTTGSIVAGLIEAAIFKYVGADPHNFEDLERVKKFCRPGCASTIKKAKGNTKAFNAKVDGGRCRNNRPTDIFLKGLLCDLDIAGCYADALRSQVYAMGIPVVTGLEVSSKYNAFPTLREFLDKHLIDLVPGLWQARVSTPKGYKLKYPQDYLISWFPPKDISNMKTATDFDITDEWWTVDNVGYTKIFIYQVHHAVITQDFIQWLANVASPRQKNELLDKLMVETVMYYPRSERVDTFNELVTAHENHKGINTCKVDKKKGVTTINTRNQECHKWLGINMGELLVDKLLKKRSEHDKGTPLNELFKLCNNAIFGDMVSPFFDVGNVCVGNNITARARALAWYMEKGLHGVTTITDGNVFDMNRVVYPRDGLKITGENAVEMYAKHSGDTFYLAPLGKDELGGGKIVLESVDYGVNDEGKPLVGIKAGDILKLTPKEAKEWVNKKAMEHLQNLFPKVSVLHMTTTNIEGKSRTGQFEFEAKGFYAFATFHGSANYCLIWKDIIKVAMRSYSKKPHLKVELNNDNEILNLSQKEIEAWIKNYVPSEENPTWREISCLPEDLRVTSEDYYPAKEFLLALMNPEAVPRAHTFIKKRILKLGDFKNNYASWKDTDIFPGCTIEQTSVLREFSLSQFTFQDEKQYTKWLREYERLKRKYGQSYEMFFSNKDGTLNYKKMVETVDAAIRAGKQGLFEGVDKRADNLYRDYSNHPSSTSLAKMQECIAFIYKGIIPQEEESLEDIINNYEDFDELV